MTYRVVRGETFFDDARRFLNAPLTIQERRILLHELERQRASLRGDRRAHLVLAQVYVEMGERLPRRLPYYTAARRELRMADLGGAPPLVALNGRHLESLVLMELGREREALEALRASEALLAEVPDAVAESFRPLQWNAMAYLLASAGDTSVRDPKRALDLAQRAVAESAGGSLNAAFLDTLAEAYFAVGRAEQALFVQCSALALAKPEGLAVYLTHYDRYARAVRPEGPAPRKSFPE